MGNNNGFQFQNSHTSTHPVILNITILYNYKYIYLILYQSPLYTTSAINALMHLHNAEKKKL